MNQTPKHHALVYDVGMHKGEDTDFYLRKGFKVIAFEADPDLVTHCQSRFSREIDSGQLTIIAGAIVGPDHFADGKAKSIKFFKNKDNSVWGTVAPEWASRNESLGTANELIDVPVVNFEECLATYGIPHYLKIDIEGMDTVCLRALLNFEYKPDYVSVEAEKLKFRRLLDELQLFTQLGYTSFKAVEQFGISRQVEPEPAREGSYAGYHFQDGSSGLFGKDLPGEWKIRRQIVNDYRMTFLFYALYGDYGKFHRLTRFRGGTFLRRTLMRMFNKPIPCWYDTHARHSSAIA